MSTTTYAYAPPQQKTRPLGVAILAVLIGIYGFVAFLAGLLIAVASSLASTLGGSNLFGALGVSTTVGGLLLLIIGLIILALAVGLWHLRMWALVLTLLFLIVEIVLYGLARNFISIGFILAVILFIYLLAVSRHFS